MSQPKKSKLGVALNSIEHFNIAKLWYLVEEKKISDPSMYINLLIEAKVSAQKWPYANHKVNFDVHPLGFGRLIPKGLCFILMERKIRQTITDGLYIDLDIENAHPCFLFQLVTELGTNDWPCLQRYVNERDSVLNEVESFFDSKHDAKSWFLKVIYGGIGIGPHQAFNDFMVQYCDEMKGIDKLVEENESLWEFDVLPIKNFLLAKGETENINRKILSHVLNGMEMQVFEETQKFLHDSRCDFSIYCYDGGMSYKPGNMVPFDAALIERLNYHIYSTLSLRVKFIIKQNTEAIFIAPEKLNSYKYENFQSWLVDQKGDYISEKHKFEKTNFFSIRDVKYYTEEPTYVREHSVTEFRQKYEHLVFRGEDKKGNPILKQFMPDWVRDPEKRKYDLVGLFPPGFEMEEPDVTFFSKWKGFAVERTIPDGFSYSEEISRFREHTLYVCSNNESYRVFLEKCIVHILTYPGKKLDMVIAFKAVQGGEGKNTWWEIHKELFGSAYCYSTQNHERDWFGDFNELLNEKVWLHMEEMSKHVLLKNQKSFLSYVTSKYDTLNFKGGAKRAVASFCNYFITFNTGGLDMFPGLRRRIWVHELNKDLPLKDATWFQQLYKDMKNPQVMRAYYDWLLRNVDIKNFKPAEDRPITPYMERLFAKEFLSKNSVDEFLLETLSQWFYNTMVGPLYKIKFSDLFTLYKNKCKEDQVIALTPQKMCSNVTDIFVDHCVRKMIRGVLYLEFTIDACIETLVQNKMMNWTDLGETIAYQEFVYRVIQPCKKACKFKDCRAHICYHLSDEARAVKYYNSQRPLRNIAQDCECGGSYFIGNEL